MQNLTVVRRALADRYDVRQVLGRGGMAIVYGGHEITGGREVAIKVLRPELAVSIAADRFLQEITILGRLHHPNILPLLDSGTRGDLVYHVSPFATGGSLADRLRSRGRLSLAETLAVARQVAAALDCAHDQYVVHRDIKPGNILFEGERALLCDFGVARAVVLAGGERLSSSGLIIGTPEYMSPEQALGAATLDARTDVYALGCVLYEMLLGEPPFSGATAQAVIARHIAQPPPPLRVVRPDLPPHVERAVLGALAKAPQDRPARAAALLAALER